MAEKKNSVWPWAVGGVAIGAGLLYLLTRDSGPSAEERMQFEQQTRRTYPEFFDKSMTLEELRERIK